MPQFNNNGNKSERFLSQPRVGDNQVALTPERAAGSASTANLSGRPTGAVASSSASSLKGGVSSYSGAASIGNNKSPAAITQAGQDKAGPASPNPMRQALPHLAEAVKGFQDKERISRLESFSTLSFVDTIGLTMSTAWSYKWNFLSGLAPFLIYMAVMDKIVALYGDQLVNNMAIGLPVALVSTFIAYMLCIGFVRLASEVIEGGEPESNILVALEPWGRLGQLIVPLFVVTVAQGAVSWVVASMVIASEAAIIAAVFAICLLPISSCYFLYFANNDEFSISEGLLEPLKMLTERSGAWLSVIPATVIFVGAYVFLSFIVVTVLTSPHIDTLMGGTVWFFEILIAALVMVNCIISYICCVYKKCEASRDLTVWYRDNA